MFSKLRIIFTVFLLLVLTSVSAAPKKSAEEKCSLNPNAEKFLKELDTTKERKTFIDLFDNLRSDSQLLWKPEVIEAMTKYPPIGNGTWADWWDNMDQGLAEELWEKGKAGGELELVRNKMEDVLRGGGGKHEWCMVCRAPKFKKWGVKVQQIQDFTTPTKELVWENPTTRVKGGHHKDGPNGVTDSGNFHRALVALIDSSNSLEEYNTKLAQFIIDWNVSPDLPDSIRLER